jgi:hypothetical protein
MAIGDFFIKVDRETGEAIGAPQIMPPPFDTYGMADMANMDRFPGYEGTAFWPVIWQQAAYDVLTEAPADTFTDLEAVPEAGYFRAVRGARPLDPADLPEAPPEPFVNPPIIGVRYSATMALGEDGELVKLVAAGDGSTGFSEAAEQSPGDVLLYMWPVPPSGYIVKVEAPGYGCSTYEAGSESGIVGARFYSLATGVQGRPPGDFHAEVQW